MSLKNFLDLRKKTPAQIKIVERVIFQKRSLKSDIFLALSVILVASTIIWGISKADTQPNPKINTEKSFSAVGIVSNITNTEMSIVNANGTDEKKDTSYTFSTIQVTKIETKDYTPISLSNIKVGDKVIVQGKYMEGNIEIKRIVSFGEVIAKEVATTTDQVATTTDETSSTTEEVATTTSIIDTIKDTVSNTISNVVDTITGTSTPTSTEEIATTTEATTTEPTFTEKVGEALGNAKETISNTIDSVIEAVTNTPEEQTPPTPPAPEPAPATEPTT